MENKEAKETAVSESERVPKEKMEKKQNKIVKKLL
jgi:hypothetical protein